MNIRGWLKRVYYNQTVSWYNVAAFYRWDAEGYVFHLVSPAGVIRYKAPNDRAISKFRDEYINQFERIKTAKKVNKTCLKLIIEPPDSN